MNSTKKVEKYAMDARAFDALMRAIQNQITNLLDISVKRCDPVELQYTMARISGGIQSARFLYSLLDEATKKDIKINPNMLLSEEWSEEIDNGKFTRQARSGAFTSTTRSGGEGTEDRGTVGKQTKITDPQPADRHQQPPESKSKDPRKWRWLRK